jgi:hypothetical protein
MKTKTVALPTPRGGSSSISDETMRRVARRQRASRDVVDVQACFGVSD